MKTLVIYTSKHGSTEKVARAMAEVLKADLKKTEDTRPETANGYDFIGFGSGIYGGKADKALFELVESLDGKGKKAFVFATSGGAKEESNEHLVKALKAQGFEVAGSFICRGLFAWGPFRLFGGMNKGRPDEKDLEDAREFAKGLLR